MRQVGATVTVVAYAIRFVTHHSVQVLKNLESGLHHYNTCLQLYNPTRYPRRWGVAALEMGMALGAMADLVERVGGCVCLCLMSG